MTPDVAVIDELAFQLPVPRRRGTQASKTATAPAKAHASFGTDIQRNGRGSKRKVVAFCGPLGWRQRVQHLLLPSS